MHAWWNAGSKNRASACAKASELDDAGAKLWARGNRKGRACSRDPRTGLRKRSLSKIPVRVAAAHRVPFGRALANVAAARATGTCGKPEIPADHAIASTRTQPLYRVAKGFGKFPAFCCRLATEIQPFFWHGHVTLTAQIHSGFGRSGRAAAKGIAKKHGRAPFRGVALGSREASYALGESRLMGSICPI